MHVNRLKRVYKQGIWTKEKETCYRKQWIRRQESEEDESTVLAPVLYRSPFLRLRTGKRVLEAPTGIQREFWTPIRLNRTTSTQLERSARILRSTTYPQVLDANSGPRGKIHPSPRLRSRPQALQETLDQDNGPSEGGS